MESNMQMIGKRISDRSTVGYNKKNTSTKREEQEMRKEKVRILRGEETALPQKTRHYGSGPSQEDKIRVDLVREAAANFLLSMKDRYSQ
jgi:hypothetical protein